MSNPWIILTAIISATAALLGVYLSNRAQEKRMEIQFLNEQIEKNLQFKRTKLEEMFNLFQRWEIDITKCYLVYNNVYSGTYDYAAASKFSNENMVQEKGDYQKFQTLLQLYFGELASDFSTVMEARGKVFVYCKSNSEYRPENLKAFHEEQVKFEAIAADFREKIVEYSKTL